MLLTPADMDISKDIHEDTWGFQCDGFIWSAGSASKCAPATAGEVEIKLQTSSGAAEFWQAGKQLGRVTGLPAAVKLVVMMMMRTNTFYLNG